MIKYWTSFAKTGDPNAQGLPVWPAFATTAEAILNLAPGAAAIALTTNPAERFHLESRRDSLPAP
jgi:para-nitrobenzyl esterase